MKAHTSDTVLYNIPQHLRESNPQLLKFMQYYYAWAEQQGNSLDLLSNLIQYKDIDSATELFANLTLKQFLKKFPESTQIDKRILVKNIREFFVAKGTIPSFEFLMNAMFSEKVSLDWQSKYVFRASDNKYTREAIVAVEIISGDFVNIVGSKVEQTLPYKTFAYVTSVESSVINGKSVAILNIDPDKIVNAFNIGSVVEILKNDVARKNATTNDFAYGVVIPCLSSVQLTNGGALYEPGDHLAFLDGNGVQVSATVGSVGLGSVSDILIENGGAGYEVGDSITTSTNSTFSASVATVDGAGAGCSCTMETHNVIPVFGGYGYAVGDLLEPAKDIGDRDYSHYDTQISVASVYSAWALKNIRIDAAGIGYAYKNLVLYNNVSDTIISGFGATVLSDRRAKTVNAVRGYEGPLWEGSISDIIITAYPTITNANVQVKLNGFNATATANLSLGAVNTITVNTQGWNYVDPVVEISGNGRGALARATLTAGRITSITVAKGGSGYTTATVTIRERFGQGFSATALLNNATTSKGVITGINITRRGVYTGHLNAYNIPFRSVSGTGFGFVGDIDFRMRSARIVSPGGGYSDIHVDTESGRGSGAKFAVTLDSGAISKVDVLEGGTGYVSSAEVVYTPSSGTPASLQTVLANGVIKQVNVVSGGSGYAATTLMLLQENTDKLLLEDGTEMVFDSIYDNLYVSHGQAGSIRADLKSDGIVSAVEILNSGSGLLSTLDVTPTLMRVNSTTGSGALLKPIIENGSIISVYVVRPGFGYSASDTITVIGNGTGAIVTPKIANGQIASVYVNQSGSAYSIGTYPFVYGDGRDAQISLDVNTGISSVEIIDGGVHSSVPLLTVVDPTGSGASLKAVVTNGTITDVIIELAGTNYTSPSITVGSGSSTVLAAYAKRELRSVDIISGGTGYNVATAEVMGIASVKPKLKCSVQRLYKSVTNAELSIGGSGYTSMPLLTVSDPSNIGAISGITIHNSDKEFSALPNLNVTSVSGTGVKMFALTEDIGRVTSVTFDSVGLDYSEIPKIAFPTNSLVTFDVPLTRTEYVKSKSVVHLTSSDIIGYTLTENNNTLECENGDNLLLSLNDLVANPYLARVNRYNWDQHIVCLDEMVDEYLFSTEMGDTIVTEDWLVLEDQRSEKLHAGDIIVGNNSSANTAVLKAYQASALPQTSGTAYYNFSFRDNSSKLNESTIKLHNNERFQDFAYVLKCGLTIDQYESFLKEVVHPAGYKMFGDFTNTNHITTPSPSDPYGGEVARDEETLSISIIFDNVIVNYPDYTIVDPLRFTYQDTPMAVFGSFKIEELDKSFASPTLNNRMSIGRYELKVDITP